MVIYQLTRLFLSENNQILSYAHVLNGIYQIHWPILSSFATSLVMCLWLFTETSQILQSVNREYP